ncbi:hypothetical protein Taro_008811 [Colocasia esculenta]|uniref:Uncharacterized protein n=1 Tax=Colocasia esculenta TaxID=4460 RepID=A0A843U838_COLES|nr:hypothetical protein [Colocasia esculenta]
MLLQVGSLAFYSSFSMTFVSAAFAFFSFGPASFLVGSSNEGGLLEFLGALISLPSSLVDSIDSLRMCVPPLVSH